MGCLVFFFFLSSLITPHSIFITHHLSLQIPKFSQPHPFDTHYSVTLFQKKKKKKVKIGGWVRCFKKKKKPKKSNIMAEISKVMGLIMKMPWKLSFGN